MDKTFDAASAEPRLSRAWEEAGAFRAGAGARRPETFCIMLPPPNVTGSLHIGHAFNHTLMDVLVRWHRMRGFDTLWQPGLDHAGIATQMVVERELAETGNIRRQDMSRDEFTALVWDWKERSGGAIVSQDKRLGCSMDWERTAFTMAGAPGDTRHGHEASPDFHDAVLRTFVDLYERGIVYRGKRLVNWDPHFETAISDLEVENVETQGHMWHFRYPLAGGATYEYVERGEDGAEMFRETRDYIAIATTRPETMLGDGAVAVSPSDERYAPIVGQLCEIPVGPREHRRLIPIITDEYPDPAFGSGAVKITGAHDFNDYAVAQRGGIPLYRLMDTRAAMRTDGMPYEEAVAAHNTLVQGGIPSSAAAADIDGINLVPDDLRGLDRYEARRKIVEQITRDGLAVMVPAADPRLGSPEAPVAPEEGGEARDAALVPLVERKAIVQPMGDRSKVVIEPMLTDQWFVDTDRIVGPAIETVRRGMARADGSTEGTKILPESEAKVYFNWLENIEPWCISRQLWWGHRIPVWWGPSVDIPNTAEMEPLEEYGPFSDEPFSAATQEEAFEKARVTYSALYPDAEVRIESAASGEMRGDGSGRRLARTAQVGAGGDDVVSIFLEQDPDVLDTWFSSALWPMGTLGWPEETPELARYYPTDVLVTGFDILFFWVARMMMMGHAMRGPEGADPEKTKPFHTVYVHALVRDEHGAKMSKSKGNVVDPLELIDRYGADALRFTLAAMASMGRDLRLSEARVEGHRNFATKLWNAARFARINEAAFGASEPPEARLTVNRWILGETARVRGEVDAALSAHRFDAAAQALYAFVWGRVCDWYLELSKPLIQGDDEAARDETRAVTGWVIDRCLVLLHPFMPFVTEALWGELAERQTMLALTPWPEEGAADEDARRETEWVIAAIEAIRSARGEMGVPAGRRVPLLVVEMGGEEADWLDRSRPLIERLARLSGIERAEAAPKGAVTIPVPGGLMALPLEGVIDVGAERERLEKSLGKLGKELGGLRGRLDNPKFVESAPEAVVAEARANLEAREAEEAKLRAALARLAEVA